MSEYLSIVGACTHNLKNISLEIPKNKLIVITGVSGSGKSSLAFDTIYAAGQRRYLESLSTYARMIVGDGGDDMKVEEIRGLSPTIAIYQKTVSNNPRSTVGTITEIYDYIRLLFTTIGTGYCPNHPEVILKKDTVYDVIRRIELFQKESRFHIMVSFDGGEKVSTFSDLSNAVANKGFVRYTVGDIPHSVADMSLEKIPPGDIWITIDRLIGRGKENGEILSRLKDSITLGFTVGGGKIRIYNETTDEGYSFSSDATCHICSYSIPELNISNFSFNSHFGACPVCHGLGVQTAFLPENVVNEKLSLGEGALLPWKQHPYYTAVLEAFCLRHKIDMGSPFDQLSSKNREKILFSSGDPVEVRYLGKEFSHKQHKTKYEGLIPNLQRRYLESDHDNDAFARRISAYAKNIPCSECHGYRLKREFLSVKIGGKNIGEVSALSVAEARVFFQNLILTDAEMTIGHGTFKNICERLEFLSGVGLDYITLNRRANTLSGGESQRIRLATQIGTRLEGIIYVLDEPSIGLHPRDNSLLIHNLKKLVEIGNTVIVVEHDEDIMEASDYIVDIGPRAGIHGGNVVFSGSHPEILVSENSETGEYLSGRKKITIPEISRKAKSYLSIIGASENNLKNIHVRIPIGQLTVVTGVSGSGKSSLIMDILANATLNYLHNSGLPTGKHDRIEGLSNFDKGIIIDQSPIGRTPHSNIATYTGVFTYIREVFASSLDAQKRGYGPGIFSFNTKGGRCEICEGSGFKKVVMHFLPDVYVECENCHGTRYNQETLDVQFKGKNIAQVLALTVEEAAEFFHAFPRITKVLKVLLDVGLGYITLGQSATTLSGGEAQRIKLAYDLAKRSTSTTLYILDEPTTGLHFSDVQKLLSILDSLVEKGNSVIVIEHNLDVIAHADALIDIGPEGGTHGGYLMYAGPRVGILSVEGSYTGRALSEYYKKKGDSVEKVSPRVS